MGRHQYSPVLSTYRKDNKHFVPSKP